MLRRADARCARMVRSNVRSSDERRCDERAGKRDRHNGEHSGENGIHGVIVRPGSNRGASASTGGDSTLAVYRDGYLYPEIQLEYAIEVCKPFINEKTDILLMPETAIVGGNDEAELSRSALMKPLMELTDSNNLCALAGAETYALFMAGLAAVGFMARRRRRN